MGCSPCSRRAPRHGRDGLKQPLWRPVDSSEMATGAIKLSDLEESRVPEVCAKTGRPAVGTLPTNALREPSRFSEILPFGRGTKIQLPASAKTLQEVTDARRLFMGWVFIAVVLLVIAIWLGVKILFPVIAGLLIGGYLQHNVTRYRKWVGARIENDEVWVTRANKTFCKEAGKIYGQSQRR